MHIDSCQNSTVFINYFKYLRYSVLAAGQCANFINQMSINLRFNSIFHLM